MGFEYFTLDDQFRRLTPITGYQSFIWTERYSAAGDFQIVTKSTQPNRSLLADGTWIGKADSMYVMKIDTVTDAEDDNGVRNLTITGSSLENLLNDRVAADITTVTTTDDTVDPPVSTTVTTATPWVETGTPGAVIRDMFNRICVETTLDEHDTIPNYTFGTLLPDGNLGEPTDTIIVTASPDTLYNTIKQIADTYSLGFRLIRNGDLGQVYFEVYVGNDLTSDQITKPAVIFAEDLNNLGKASYLTSSAALKTVAYVYATNGMAVVFAPTADQTAVGANRRVLIVNSSNDGPVGDDLTTALTQEGLIALAQQRQVYAFDGELPAMNPYVYGVDYNLGDLVEQRSSDGYSSQMLVTEQIFSSDDTGDTTYPTLTVSQVITPGSWTAWTDGTYWDDVPDADTWAAP